VLDMKLVEKAVISVLLLILASSFVLSVVQAYMMTAETQVYVHPDETKVEVGEVFNIYINVRDVSGLQGFDFMLKYDTDVLDCLALEEGAFLSKFGDTFTAKQEINDEFACEYGRVWLVIVLLGKDYADGSGTIAVLEFKATAVGESVLDLYSDYPYEADQVKLATCCPEAIPNVAVDGHVVVDCCSNNPGSADPPDDPPNDPVDPPSPDINGDGFVNIKDLMWIARAYGTSTGNDRYQARADLNEDGSIDIHDIYICAKCLSENA
jgi:hypothetical protein